MTQQEETRDPQEEEKRDPRAEYRELYARLGALTTLEMLNTFGKSLDGPTDARANFLKGLEMGRAVARAEMTGLSRVLIEVLQVDEPLYWRYVNQEMQRGIEQLQTELGVAGYDEAGNPLVHAAPT